MIYTLDEARDILHLDGEDNDEQILALLDAIPPYLTATTGYESVTGDYSPVQPVKKGRVKRPFLTG